MSGGEPRGTSENAARAPPSAAAWVTAAKRFAARGYEASIIRRTMLLCALVVPAFGANFLVYYFGTALLSPESFGVFYVANTLGNVLFSGSVILNTLFTRHLVKVAADAGEQAAVNRWLAIERVIAGRGALVAGLTFIVLLAVGHLVGMRSWTIAFLVVVDTYVAYIADLGRALLQSLRRTLLLGLYTLAWMVGRLALCVAGIVAFATAGGALLGSVVAALAVIFGYHFWIASKTSRPRPASTLPSLPSLLQVAPLMLSYATLIALSSLDVFASFFLLSERDLGAYSASSVLPKAILVVMMPLTQLLFALTTAEQANPAAFRRAARKSGAVVFGLTAAGAIAVWLTNSLTCGGRWGLSHCDDVVVKMLLLATLPLSLLRALVLMQFARGHDWRVLFLVIPAALYLWIEWASPPGARGMAGQFAIFSAVCFVSFLGLCAGAERLQQLRAGRGADRHKPALFSRRSFVRRR